ncbi:M10 family metallopeptidase C-terminal domain-containing protein [Paracoccus shandongensis]|uniref:calcium-binding protein n=1 Tax=Paracoccus shandongensis TaxID=2816048 RepID=UPI001F02BE89
MGNDTYVTDGRDRITEAVGAGIDLVKSSASYALGANLENLVLTGTTALNGTGNGLDNRITGNAAANILKGGGGNDVLSGRAGADRLLGDAGDDILNGGSGGDRLVGGRGQDDLFGGVDASRDVFVFTSHLDSAVGRNRDVVNDFTTGLDDLDLRLVDAVASTAGTNEAFRWAGTTAAAHSVWWTEVAGQGVLVRGDVTGDARADFEILLSDISSLGAGDVLL